MTDIVERLQAKIERWEAQSIAQYAEIERLRAALQEIAAEADGGRLSANDDELRDWLMTIRDVAHRALEPKP